MNQVRTSSPVANVPALVVSGFLGSGKTTLVRHLLADAAVRGYRVAVVSNEFGELGIDKVLLGQGDEAYVEIEGGCVCCRLSEELIDTLEMLRERVNPDRIVVETSGVALPYDTLVNFWREPVCEWLGDDAAVVVVNAEQVKRGDQLDGTFADQVSSADLLLLNKIDLVSRDDLESIETLLRELEPRAPILYARHCAVDPAALFPPDPGGLRSARDPLQQQHQHELFESEELEISPGVDRAQLRERLEAMDLLRVKGFVSSSEGTMLVQGVGPRVEISPPPTAPPAELLGRLVMIRRPKQRPS